MTDGGQFDSEMGEENLLGTFPLLSGGRNLVRLQFPLLEVWYSVDDDPRNAASKIYNLGAIRRQEIPPDARRGTYFV